MALLFMKRALFPKWYEKQQQRYSALRSSSSEGRYLESRASESTASDELSEKHDYDEHRANTRKIDPRIISDATLGLSDGLTVPFALTAGLSHFGDSRIVIYGGLAELLAGCISMGLGGYLGSKSEAESSQNERASISKLVHRDPVRANELIREKLDAWDLPPELMEQVVHHVQSRTDRAERLLVGDEGADQGESNDMRRAYVSALTIALGYFSGGFIPLLPYFFLHHVRDALILSSVIMGTTLFCFGYCKTRLAGQTATAKNIRGGLEMAVLGGAAAGVAIGCIKLSVVWEKG